MNYADAIAEYAAHYKEETGLTLDEAFAWTPASDTTEDDSK